MTEPRLTYRVVDVDGQYGVFVVRREFPRWWQLVAVFTSKERAEGYAEVEQDMADDDCKPYFADETADPPNLDEPETAVRLPKRLPAPDPVESHCNGNGTATETEAAEEAEPEPEPEPDTADDEEEPADDEDESESRKDTVDPTGRTREAHGLPEIQGRARDIFNYLSDLADARGYLPSKLLDLGGPAGIPEGSVYFAVDSLHKRGYIARRSNGGGRLTITLVDGRTLVSLGLPPEPRQQAARKNHPEPEAAPAVADDDRSDAKRPAKKTDRPFRRFTDTKELDPKNVNGLADNHPAVVEGRTLFPTTVVNPEESPRLLVSGKNSRKLGDRVTKGPWKGMPIYQLTLEERATCPRSCHHWSTCYGNGMQLARRHRHGPALVKALDDELQALNREHQQGFVVRLHVLGDFYSADYVRVWGRWLAAFKYLHVFGYTAWGPDTEIGKAIHGVVEKFGERFAIRESTDNPDDDSPLPLAVTICRKPEGPVVPEGIVCPAQAGATECCGSCGLCWSQSAKDKAIVFVAHGRVGSKPAKVRESTLRRPAQMAPDGRVPSKSSPLRRDPPEITTGPTAALQYLIDAGYAVEMCPEKSCLWIVEGETLTGRQVIGMANSERIKAGLEPFPMPQLDFPTRGTASSGRALVDAA